MNAREIVILVSVVVIIVAVVVTIALSRRDERRRTARLRARFGPEYERAVAEYGDRGRAEKALERREKEARNVALKPLSAPDRQRFAEKWRSVQARFVDAPGNAVVEADQLLGQLMNERGYPSRGFAERAGIVAVDHPVVVQNYRKAHEIAELQRTGKATTEELREAIIQYRALYEELLDGQPVSKSEVRG